MKDLLDVVKSFRPGKIDPIYFLNGDDFFLQTYFVGQLEKIMGKTGKPERIYLVPEVADYPAVLRQLNEVSLFPQPKLFVLQNPVQIRGKTREELLAYCRSPNRDNCLVIIIDKFDPNIKLVKELSLLAGGINSSPPFEGKMKSWVAFLAKKRALSTTDDAADRLLELAGDSVYHLSNEIEKITLGMGNRTVVEEEDVLRYAGWGRSFFPWHFLDAIGNRSFHQAVFIGNRLLNQGSDLVMLVSLMGVLFQEMLFRHLKSDGDKGQSVQGFWLGKQVRQRLPTYVKRYDVSEIRSIFRILAEADRHVKTSSPDARTVLIPLLYRITMDGV